jgi:glycosyltransferase involved in cell wall biosynthesis
MSSRKVSICLLIPVLNEGACLPKILPQINPSWVDEIVFVDGGSTDNTREEIRAWGHGRLVEQQKKGLTVGYFESYPHISSEAIISFSPDGNSLPEAIPELVSKMQEGYDMVIASRYMPGAKSEDDDAITRLGNWMFTRTVNILFGGNYTDSLVMLRAYRKSLVERLALPPENHVFEPLLAVRCAKHGCRVTEIPASEPKRIAGERKMRIFINGWAILKMILREWLSGKPTRGT